MTDRNETIKQIRTNLRSRGLKWVSVTGGRGTAWGWIRISTQPSKGDEYGNMTEEQRAELAEALGLERVHFQGESIPASSAYYEEYIARSKGETPTRYGEVYWD